MQLYLPTEKSSIWKLKSIFRYCSTKGSYMLLSPIVYLIKSCGNITSLSSILILWVWGMNPAAVNIWFLFAYCIQWINLAQISYAINNSSYKLSKMHGIEEFHEVVWSFCSQFLKIDENPSGTCCMEDTQ